MCTTPQAADDKETCSFTAYKPRQEKQQQQQQHSATKMSSIEPVSESAKSEPELEMVIESPELEPPKVVIESAMFEPQVVTESELERESKLLSSSVIGSVTIVGGSGGSEYHYKAWLQGKVISQIRIWTVAQRIKACKLWMTGETDNQGTQYGTPEGSSYIYKFQPGELITSMSLWQGDWDGNIGTRAGCIMFTTNKGGYFNHGYKSGPERVIKVYSGILVGADIRAGADISAWGFAFMKPLLTCRLQDVSYTNLSGLGGISPETLDSLKSSNKSSGPINWEFKGEKTKTVSGSWSQEEGITFTMGVTVSAGIPEIAQIEEKFEWQQSQTYTQQSEYSAEHKLSWSQNGTLESGQSIDIKAMTWTGSISVPYNGTMLVVVDGGASYTFPRSGRYDGIGVTRVEVVAK